MNIKNRILVKLFHKMWKDPCQDRQDLCRDLSYCYSIFNPYQTWLCTEASGRDSSSPDRLSGLLRQSYDFHQRQ